MTAVVPRQRVIPGTAWAIAAVVAVLFWVTLTAIFVHDSESPIPATVLVPPFLAAVLGGYILLIGYIYGDAKRRCMRYIAWTLLAALAPSAIGILLYFILREPLPVHCTKCGCAMNPKFAFCPRCGGSTAATCQQCHRVAEGGWSHCAWCGTKL